MPFTRTTKNGKPAYKWGKQGNAYVYTPGNKKSRNAAKRKAFLQGRAVKSKG